jgi:excisionase family DNA binding protein
VTASPQYLTPDEVAGLLRCNPEKIYRLCSSGQLRSLRFGGRRLIDRDDLNDYIEQLKAAA